MNARTILMILSGRLAANGRDTKVIRGDVFNHVEKELVKFLITTTEWNITKAAKWAGVDRKRFARLLTKYSLTRPRVKRSVRKAA